MSGDLAATENPDTACFTSPPPFPLLISQFRALFPAFADTGAFPDATIQMWLDLAANFVNCAWGPMQAFGQGLWAAHELAKLTMAGAPGQQLNGIVGVPSSRAVDSVSVSYDTSIGTVEGAGSYNLTIYGRQWYQLSQIFGMGPWQFGPPEPVPIGTTPWVGPWPYVIAAQF